MSFPKTARGPVALWAAAHLLLLLGFLLKGGISISTNLYEILPDTNSNRNLSAVENILTGRLNSKVSILIGTPDFESTEEEALAMEDYLSRTGGFKDIRVQMDSNYFQVFQDFLFAHRYHYLSPTVKEALEQNNIEALWQNFYFQLSSPFSMADLSRLEEDPFLLSSSHLQDFLNSSLLSSSAMSVRDSFLYREQGGMHWILITASTDQSGSEVSIKENPLARLLAYRETRMEAGGDDLAIVYSGVPVHSYLAARQSQREISLLSTLSTVFIVLLILAVFRSFLPLGATFFSIAVGILSGLTAVSLVFRDVHIFTIVFGTSLIGITVDYSFHYFTHWAEKSRGGKEIRKDVLPGITVGLITTVVSYSAFFFCPFPLMRQMALFSLCGLGSVFLSATLLYPFLPASPEKTVSAAGKALSLAEKLFRDSSRLPQIVRYALLSLIAVFLILGITRIDIHNSVSDYYTMSPQMREWEKTSAEVIDSRTTGVYLTIEGKDREECLERAGRIEGDLANFVENGTLGNYISLSRFLPSRKEQDAGYNLVKTRMAPHVKSQFDSLRFPDGSYESWEKDFASREEEYLTWTDLQDLPLSDLWDTLEMGETGGRHYINVLLFDIKDTDSIKAWADDQSGIYLMNKISETNETLEKLSRLSIIIIGLSYLLIFLLLLIRYSPKKAFSTVFIPLMASLIALNTVALTGRSVNLFVIVGLILIPGMGSDYLILLNERRRKESSVYLSIIMSLSTTLLAFALLGTTKLAGGFGITVAAGLLSTFLLTLFLGPLFEEP